MQLLMLFGNEVVDKIAIDGYKMHQPGYITFLQEELIVRNEELLECCADEPRFALENVPSRMNRSTFAVPNNPAFL